MESKFKGRALGIGTVFHAGCASWYMTDFNETAAVAECMAIDEELERADRLLAAGMVKGYAQNYAGCTWEILEIEKDMYVTVNGTDFIVKMDGIVRIGMDVWVLEHKTASRIDRNYWAQREMDLQIDLYLIAAKMLGYNPKGVLYDVVVKPKLKFLDRETEEQYINRCAAWVQQPGKMEQVQYIRTPEQLEYTTRDTTEMVACTQRAIKSDQFPRNMNACFDFYRDCEFLPVCQGRTTLEDDMLYQVRKR